MNFNDNQLKITHGEKIFDLKFKVVYYARVSTDSDVQLNSLENQLNYYENYIKAKPNWTFIGGYVEEGVSGVTVEKRDSFKKMIRDAKLHKFDLIITKEVSRFARDLEDSIHYIRELKENGVGIFFENQNLNTFDPNSELILNIMFNLAQEESRKLSSRVKFGQKEAIRKGHVLGSSNIIGYKKDKCKLVIVKEEAEFIKKVFELYATGEYGLYKLSFKLSKLGYLNKKNNLYDKDTLKRIIENPKYKGYYRAGVYEILDYRTKKRKKNSVKEQIIYKCTDGSIPKIISEEMWNKANDILSNRTKKYTEKNNYTGSLKYPFSSKIYCAEHNVTFQRSHGSKKKNRPVWACGKYLQYRLSACSSPIIAESDLYIILKRIKNEFIISKDEIIFELTKLYQNNYQDVDYKKEIKIIIKKIKQIEEKKSILLNLVQSNELSRDSLIEQFKLCEKEKEKLLNSKIELEEQIKKMKNKDNILDLNNIVNNKLESVILENFVRDFLDKIIVSKIDKDRNNIKLDIYINLLNYTQKIYAQPNYILLLENIVYCSSETKKNDNKNKFTYNVYVESL